MRHEIRLTVNGREYAREVESRTTLVDFLRDQLDLTGTHVGCEHGACGACTVLLDGDSIRACLLFAVQADGASITTVEGLAGEGALAPLQQAFWDNHGLQCGFCTPGMLLTASELLAANPAPSEAQVRDAISGVLCRCTGYRQIIDSIRAAARPAGAEEEPAR